MLLMLPPRPATAAARPSLHSSTLLFPLFGSRLFRTLINILRSWSSTLATSQEASLLSIPPELRLHIYDAILDADIDYPILESWRSVESRHQGFSSEPKRHEQTKLDVIWCNLLLACKTIHVELNSHMGKTRTGAYIAEIERCRHALGAFRWRKLGCAPRHIENMLVIFKSESDRKWDRFWGVEGPLPIVRELSQSLNVLLHCGPRTDVSKQLPEPMHIGKLTIVLALPASKRCPPERDSSSVRDDRVTNFEEVRGIASTVCAQGIVHGLIDSLCYDYRFFNHGRGGGLCAASVPL
ncbi:hypothetical protein CERZMDRAFT_101087 [Cercospora zeae-maydis SCOH1-5]|uniref:Uncharacterized protein n=1 Tax=Cercospora zeae-maydis SCOH1-5 TaxID=717836 RepID=A0A6A6F3Y5_9PEZI|nr:hypothetical protein CERZMDRAFT_101087 [Cercospora zeae-maydis SCOH1-5]